MDKVKEIANLYEENKTVTVALEECPERTYQVPEALLRTHSRYFAAALDAGFMEAETRVLKLPGCSTETLHLLLCWMTSHELPKMLPLVESAGPCPTKEEDDEIISMQQRLVRVWIFADSVSMPKLQNAAMRAMTSADNQLYYFVPDTVEIVMAESPADSRLRLCAIDRMAAACNTQKNRYDREDDWDTLGAIPGVMRSFVSHIANSECGKLVCKCKPNCYFGTIETYLVSEE